ncbi:MULTISPECIES: NAD(P)-binding domain-containing protein [Brevibacterium]|uniref:Predicted flavoprotein CzcO associated with the cation diffusion facilitator CzcD n=1 Tax=Brevibacterium antiquum CNRZ 918 TaxID=1255637 RepID=A0A2H1K9A9_9MICO|nr:MULTISPECIES: NAD(P)-binding domain-containing protein [Brevibacterium]SMX96407.1 Predicted flavoprotein CzcO associated with the cation diffusion facilitator CzcD [Brevibacterium antiquum CNRZ 918]HCG55827.1 NAD(P)/FAD-dependent oxidoreductase [Brevibacterium sp.]
MVCRISELLVDSHWPIVIIGAGQAGLSAAHYLWRDGLVPGKDFIVLDAGSGPGGAWRERWDSLTLGSTNHVADLPGFPLGTPDPSVPASAVVSDYYSRFERELELCVVRPAEVVTVNSPTPGSGPLEITTKIDGERIPLSARYLINATGTWTHPYVPFVPGIAEFEGRQLHTANFRDVEDFRGLRTLVVGGGISATQFLLELATVTQTLWATRRPPNFTSREFDGRWGLEVERAVRSRTLAGLAPASVVRTTGLPVRQDFRDGVESEVLVSRGMFDAILPHGVHFPGRVGEAQTTSEGLGPSASDHLALPESWQPFDQERVEEVDVIFWNTGFRAALNHLAPLHLRTPDGGISMETEVSVKDDRRIFLVGYGSASSTVGATRAGRIAARELLKRRTGAPRART